MQMSVNDIVISRAEHGGETHLITEDLILQFEKILQDREKSIATIDKYTRDVRHFYAWLDAQYSKTKPGGTASLPGRNPVQENSAAGEISSRQKDFAAGESFKKQDDCTLGEHNNTRRAVGSLPGPETERAGEKPAFRADKETVRQFKQYLKEHYKLSSVNSMLSALNTFFKYMGWPELTVMIFKTQRAAFRSTERDLTLAEYRDLVRTAERKNGRGKKGSRQIALIMETLAGTGIRVSELPFITVESLAARRTTVSLKGKTRTVLLNSELCKKLRVYCRERGITSGSIFVTRTGRPVDRGAILRRMKALAEPAGVLRDKIFPHNLRHLFAVTYYEKEKDIVRLADLLGHANINTTRIYTQVSFETQLDILDELGTMLNPAG